MTASLDEHYDRFYEGPSEWRLIGARSKVSNIVGLWQRGGEPSSVRPPIALDIGCGDGAVLSELSRSVPEWQCRGLEISSSALAACESRGVVASHFDGRTIPYEAQSVDLCILSHVVEHLPNPRLLLEEAARVGRWVFVEVPLEYTIRTPRDFTWNDIGHINLYDQKLIRHLVQSCALEIENDRLSNSTRDLYCYGSGAVRGTLRWLPKQIALQVCPRPASRVFVYNYSLLARSASVSASR